VVTTLRSGKVQVAAGTQTLLLQPNEQSTFLEEEGSLQKKVVEPGDYLAWVKGDLYFDVVPLNNITESLSRYYDYTFKFDDPAVGRLNFTLDMPLPSTLQEVLTSLKASRGDLRFKVEGKTVTISKQP
jgi:ferric-dicitrate binding protein FerR (iron transport regulator)